MVINKIDVFNYCPSCHCSREILLDELNSKGMTRSAKEARIESAKEYIARCKDCTEYFKDILKGK